MTQAPLSWWGEFHNAAMEVEYRTSRLPEFERQARLVFLCAAILNALFVFSDWRFYGQPHFAWALAARGVITAASLFCLALLRKPVTLRRLNVLCAAWCPPVIAASAVLLIPQSEAARLILLALPAVFYLTLPLPVRWALLAGAGFSAVTLCAHLFGGNDSAPHLAVALAVTTLNIVLALALLRISRLQRLEWVATRAASAANRELSEKQIMLQTLLRAVPAPLVIIARDSGQLMETNNAAREFFGHALANPKELLQCLLEATVPAACGQILQHETCLPQSDHATPRNVLVVETLVVVGGQQAIIAIVVDITRRKEMEAHLKMLAATDPLTGLMNRARFFELAHEEISRAHRYERPLAVVMLDIDLFKNINDTYGHEAGDTALRAFADLCRAMVRSPDSIGRIGGEEFALLLPETNRTNARALAERLRAAVASMRIDGLPVTMTISVGVSEVLPSEDKPDAALSRADAALYEAKRGGRNRVVLHL